MMRLYGAIQKLEPQDDGTVRVHGIATSEAVDDQGEIVRADAIRAAIPDYMRFPALREMHQLSAAGTTLEAEVCEDGTTRIVAHVIDPVAVAKVKNQVYRGFSIGGRVTQREPGNPKAVTGLVLNEISLVDRPANPEAVFDCWKSSMTPNASFEAGGLHGATPGLASFAAAVQASEPFNSPVQIWSCNVPNHRHLAKSDAVKCLAERAAPLREAVAASPAATAPIAAAKTEPAADPDCCKAPRADALELGLDDNMRAAVANMLGCLAAMLGKNGPADQHMMDLAHSCVSALTDGAVCAEPAKAGPRSSRETMGHLEAAHHHLVAAGAECNAANATQSTAPSEEDLPSAEPQSGKGARVGRLAKALAGERAEKAALVEALGGIVPTLERLTRRVDDIARTPLPPLTIAKGTMSVSKQQDRGGASGGDPELSSEAIASALSKMSKEEQTLMLIKASYANPLRVIGSAATER
jgi:hypothetical protein